MPELDLTLWHIDALKPLDGFRVEAVMLFPDDDSHTLPPPPQHFQ